MCFQVYLGADIACPEIPYAERNDDRTRFPQYFNIALFVHKHPERSGYAGTIAGLTTPFQYHVGIMGCGCGFALNTPANQVADGGWEVNNHRQLARYVDDCLTRTDVIALASFWNRDEGVPPEQLRRITVADLYDPGFCFAERQLTLVYADAEGLARAVTAG